MEFSVGSSTIKRRITHVIDPVNKSDAATKGYIDGKTIKVIDIASKTTATAQQLNEIATLWPYVAVFNGNAICPGAHKNINIGTGKTTSFSFIYANRSNSLANDDVVVGPSAATTEALYVDQINIDATTGAITHNTGRSLFPIIATNPSLSSTGSVKAIGNNTVAIGGNSAATGPSSTAVGDSSKALNNASTAVGSSSVAGAIGSIAIGSNAHASHAQSTALGMGSFTDKGSQVSIGSKASGITRYLSNVKDPVDDQDAATRYWTKNADRSDVFAPNFTMTIPGNGTGEFYLEANADLNWIAVRGYAFWNAFSDAWAVMTNLPGENNNNWWIKTELKVPNKMIPKANFIGYAAALDFIGNKTVPYYSDKIAVGTDGYIYLTSWSMNHGSTPLGILCLGHRFYM